MESQVTENEKACRVKYVKEVSMLGWGLYHFREALHIRYYAQHHPLRNFRAEK